jgi:hypothetical protein
VEYWNVEPTLRQAASWIIALKFIEILNFQYFISNPFNALYPHFTSKTSHLPPPIVTSSKIQITPVNLNLVSRSHFCLFLFGSRGIQATKALKRKLPLCHKREFNRIFVH